MSDNKTCKGDSKYMLWVLCVVSSPMNTVGGFQLRKGKCSEVSNTSYLSKRL